MILTMECVVCPFPHPNVSSRAPCILIPREVVQRSGETFQKELVSPAGLEPATHSLEGCCSVQLSYGEWCTGAEVQRFRESTGGVLAAFSALLNLCTCEPFLVGSRGFEPPTPFSHSRCDTRPSLHN